MKTLSTIALTVASLGILQASVAGLRQPAYRVTSLPPIVVENIASGVGFVGGTDGVPRTCPNEVNVGVFIRVEAKGAANVFQTVSRDAQLISTPTRGFTIACLKVDLPKK